MKRLLIGLMLAQLCSASAAWAAEESVEDLRLRAAQGESDALNRLGMSDRFGRLTPEGVQLLTASARAGKLGACKTLMNAYESRDASRFATVWLRAAAAQGDHESIVEAVRRLRQGDGVPRNERAAVALLVPLAEHGDPGALSTLAEMAELRQVDASVSLKLFQRAAELGSPTGQRLLGVRWRSDGHLPEALAALGKAAALGDHLAMAELADMAEQGIGMPKDPVAAAGHWQDVLGRSEDFSDEDGDGSDEPAEDPDATAQVKAAPTPAARVMPREVLSADAWHELQERALRGLARLSTAGVPLSNTLGTPLDMLSRCYTPTAQLDAARACDSLKRPDAALEHYRHVGWAVMRAERLRPYYQGGGQRNVDRWRMLPEFKALEAAGRAGSGPACALLSRISRYAGSQAAELADAWLERGRAAHDPWCGAVLAERLREHATAEVELAAYRTLFAGQVIDERTNSRETDATRRFWRANERESAWANSYAWGWSSHDLGKIRDLASAKAYDRSQPELAEQVDVTRAFGSADDAPPTLLRNLGLGALLQRKAMLADDSAAKRRFLGDSAAQGFPSAQYLWGLELAARPQTAIQGAALLELAAAQNVAGARDACDEVEAGLRPAARIAAQDQALQWWDGLYR